MGIKLMEHQKEALEYLKDLNKCALFIKAGQGKTYIALEKFKNFKNTLIITTCKDFNNKRWEKEAAKYNHKGQITVINYEKLRNKDTFKAFINKKYDSLIVDECHHFKNNTRSTDSKNINKLSKKIPNVLGLTGTHSPNNYVETFKILNNLDCNPFIQTSEKSFIEYFYNYRTIPVAGHTIITPSSIKKDKEQELLETIKKVSYVYFPEDIEHDNFLVIIDRDLPEIYSDVEKGIFLDNTISVLVKIRKLEQLANGFYFEKKKPFIIDLNKKKALKKVLLANKGDNFIIVYKFIPDKTIIEDLIQKIGINAIVLHSSQSEAMNLQEYNHIVFYSPGYSSKDLEQMKARIMRVGQKKKPKFTTLIRKGTIEEYIIEVVDKKIKNSDKLGGFEQWKHQNQN